jgi:hypothetical protein
MILNQLSKKNCSLIENRTIIIAGMTVFSRMLLNYNCSCLSSPIREEAKIVGQIYRLLSITLLMMIGFSTPVEGREDAYYTWVDENGVTNYSQRDPKIKEATYVTRSAVRFGRRSLSEPATDTNQESGGEENTDGGEAGLDPEAQMQKERDEVQKEIARIKESNCEIGKRNLAKLEAYARIRVKDATGEEVVLSEEEKQKRVNEARATIRENCTG